jgi:hypothetical protein
MSDYLVGAEPSFYETDEDGDTRAGGYGGGIWFELLRQRSRIDVALMHGDPRAEEGKLTFLEEKLDPDGRAREIAVAIIEGLVPSSFEVRAMLTEFTPTRRDSLLRPSRGSPDGTSTTA